MLGRMPVAALIIFHLCVGHSYSQKKTETVCFDSKWEVDADQFVNDEPGHWRWLSLPKSRLVLNPAWWVADQPVGPMRKDLALDIGYWHGSKCHLLRDVITCTAGSDSLTSPEVFEITRPDDLLSTYLGQAEGVVTASSQKCAKITSLREHGYISIFLDNHFKSQHIKVSIDIANTDGHWGLKFNSGIGDDNPTLVAGSPHHGKYDYDVDLSTIEKYGDTLQLKIFVIGKGKSVWVKSLKVASVLEIGKKANKVKTAWYPYKLTYDAGYKDADVKIKGLDAFANDDVIIRRFDIENLNDNTLFLSGYSNNGNLSCPEPGIVLCEQAEFSYAICFSGFEKSGEMKKLSEPKIVPNYFIHQVKPPIKRSKMFISVGFASGSEGPEEAVRKAKEAIALNKQACLVAKAKAAWESLLSKVPVPEKFGIGSIDNLGVTPEKHRLFYYGAWCFIISDVLPPMSENDYPYPQLATGKPSGWSEGASKAKASAAWESFFGQQFLGYIMPEVSWRALEGILSQVDEDGWLDGECLPSRKAQTAWKLYDMTGDHARLKKLYPAIKRYLLWREKNPRWIYGSHDFPEEKDTCFVVAWFADVKHAIRIAETLGYTDDIRMWREHYDDMIESYREWFFYDDARPPENFYFADTGKHSHPARPTPDPSYILKGLYLDDLPQDVSKDLKAYYLKIHDKEKRIAGFDLMKYPEAQYIVLGLIKHGMTEQARELADILIRDTIITGEFAEVLREDTIKPIGVLPSLFSACQMIDLTWINNSVRCDQGKMESLDF